MFSAPPPGASQGADKLTDWGDALERMWSEVAMLHHSREIYAFLNDQLTRLPHGGVVQWTLTRWYVDAQASCIRRLAWPGGNGTESLSTLLADVHDHPAVLGAGRHGVSTADIPDDLQRLTEIAHKTIGMWTNQNVAHMGLKRTARLDESEFNDVVDALGDLLTKYFLLVKGDGIGSVAPNILVDWQAPFRQAWLPPVE
jgi:hypothetical protein